MPKDELEKLVKMSTSLGQILNVFGLSNKGGNSRTLKQRLAFDHIDFSHIPLGLSSNSGRKFFKEKTPLKKILTENSFFCRTHLKRRLIDEGILKNICAVCGQKPEWNSKPLVLVLDHKNGVANDNRIENLWLLCPNCNSQTETFGSRNRKKTYNCKSCGKKIGKQSELCISCNSANHRKIKNRPTIEELQEKVSSLGFSGTGRLFGVSGNAVKKWMK